jgi:tetratricopeptide (TPR) repeat protein
MVAKGHTNRVIAKVLHISLWTVDTHMRRIFAKLQVSTRAAMVATMVGAAQDQPPSAGPPIFASDGQEAEGGEPLTVEGGQAVPSMSGGSLLDLSRRRASGIVGHSPDPGDPPGGMAISTQAPWKLDPEGQSADDQFHAQDVGRRSLAQGSMEVARRLVEPPPVRSDREGPSALLRPEFEVVPFSGREAELSRLERWCAEPGAFGIRLVTGPAGQGKSRLARQFCERLTARGWLAGPLGRAEFDEATLRHLQVTSVAVLLVVDRAETRTDQLASLVNGLIGRKRAGRVRLLLLARAAGDWWEGFRRESRKQGSMLDGIAEHELAALHSTLNDRQRGFRDAVAAFARHRGHIATPSVMPDLADPKYGSVLNVHLAALAAVLRAEQPTGRSARLVDPTARALECEQGHWSDVARASELTGTYQQVDLDRAVAAATLCGADDEEQAVALLRRIPNLPETDHVVRLARLIRRLYPSRNSYWGTLQPELLGEELVAMVTADPSVPGGPAGLLGTMLADASAPQATRALSIVVAAAPRHVHLREALVPLLQRDPARLLLPAGAVATQVPDPRPLARALRVVLDSVADGTLVLELARLLPWPSLALADLAMAATRQALDQHRARSGADPKTEAELLSVLAVQLSDVGRREGALSAIEEAVTISRGLAEAAPDAFLPDLARALNNLSNQLSDVGRREGALSAIEDAVAHYRRLAETAPDAFLPDLALSLNNLATSLADVGRREAALRATEEAVTISRGLAEAAPDAFLPDLALSLNNRSLRLIDMGRREAALAATEEAVAISRGLGEAAPDTLLPSLPRRSVILRRTLSSHPLMP